MTTVLAVVLPAIVVFVVAAGLVLLATANRLDRLHVRVDAGWAALDNALARRAVVSRVIAATALPEGPAGKLCEATRRAERAERYERARAENLLTHVLNALDRGAMPEGLAVELADAENRVVIATHVHNDAVRDTLLLRRRRMVRVFRLAGTAPLPEYFELVESDPDSPSDVPAT